MENTIPQLLDKHEPVNNEEIILEEEVGETLQRPTSDSKNTSVSGIITCLNRSDIEQALPPTCQTKEGIKQQGEDSLEFMKKKISSYLSYLESDTDSSDTELNASNDFKSQDCQTEENIHAMKPHYNETDYEFESTIKKRRSCTSTKDDVKICQLIENLYIEKTFKLFTTKWDVKSRQELRKPSQTSTTPVFKQFHSKCDVRLIKQCEQLPSLSDKPQLYQVNNEPKKIEGKKIIIIDSTNVKTNTNVPSISDCSVEKDRSEITHTEKDNFHNSLPDETLLTKTNIFEKQSENNFNDNLWKRNVDSVEPLRPLRETKPCTDSCNDEYYQGELFGKSVVEKGEYKISPGQSHEHTGGSEKKLKNKASVERDVTINSNSRTSVQKSSNDPKFQSKCEENKCVNKNCTTSVNGEKLESGNCFKKTKHQFDDGHVNDHNTEKNSSQGPPKIAKNTNKTRSPNECEHPSHEQKNEIATNCKLAEDESKRNSYKETKVKHPEEIKDKIKRSRNNPSSGRKRRRSRSLSTDRRRKDSPIQESRNSQTTRRMQYSRSERRTINRHSNEPAYGSWIDNIVVKIADPPRPPRNRQRNIPKRVETAVSSQPTKRNIRRHSTKSSSNDGANQNEESKRMRRKRRWTYDDYVKGSDGRLRRKTSYDDDSDSYLKRYDDKNVMPYKGYADSQVQSLLKQMCGHYITELYSSKQSVKCQSSYIAVSDDVKSHRTWYMTSSNWISYSENTSTDTASFDKDATIETSCFSPNSDQQKSDQSSPTALEKQKYTLTTDYKEVTFEKDTQLITSHQEIQMNHTNESTERKKPTMDVEDIQHVLPSEDQPQNEAPELKNKDKDTTGQNFPKEIVPCNEEKSNQPVGKPLCKKTQTNEVSKQPHDELENSENSDELNNGGKHYCNMEIVAISEIRGFPTCGSSQIQSDGLRNDKDGHTEKTVCANKETNLPGVQHAIKSFAADTFAVSKLCKSSVTSLGQEVSRNELLVMVTPSSYLYEKKISGKEKPLEDVLRKQSFSVPTSTCLSKSINVPCTSVCFHFDIDHFDTLSLTEKLSDMKQNQQGFYENVSSVPIQEQNTKSGSQRLHLDTSESESHEQTITISDVKKQKIENKKILAYSSDTESKTPSISSKTVVHRNQSCDKSDTVKPIEKETSIDSDKLESADLYSTTHVKVSTEDHTFEKNSNGISSNHPQSLSQEIDLPSLYANLNNDQHKPSPTPFIKPDINQERPVIHSKVAESNVGEEMWDLALMTSHNSKSIMTSSTTQTHSKGCDVDVAIVKPSRRANTVTATDEDVVVHRQRVQSLNEMQEMNNNHINISNEIQKNSDLHTHRQNCENSMGYPCTPHNSRIPSMGSNGIVSGELMRRTFNKPNIQISQQNTQVMIDGQQSVPATVSTYPPPPYPISHNSRMPFQTQQPEFIEQALSVNYPNGNSFVSNNRFAPNNQDTPLSQHPAFINGEQPNGNQRWISQHKQMTNPPCNTNLGRFPAPRTTRVPVFAIENAFADCNAAHIADSYSASSDGRQEVCPRNQEISNLSTFSGSIDRYCDPMISTSKRAYPPEQIINRDQRQTHRIQEHKQQQQFGLQQQRQEDQQQQHFHRDERLSENWHTTFLNSIQCSPSDVSHIPWGQHVLDRSHQSRIKLIPRIQQLTEHKW